MNGWKQHSSGGYWPYSVAFNISIEPVIRNAGSGEWWVGDSSGSLYLCGANLMFYNANYGYWESKEAAKLAVEKYLSLRGMPDFIV